MNSMEIRMFLNKRRWHKHLKVNNGHVKTMIKSWMNKTMPQSTCQLKHSQGMLKYWWRLKEIWSKNLWRSYLWLICVQQKSSPTKRESKRSFTMVHHQTRWLSLNMPLAWDLIASRVKKIIFRWHTRIWSPTMKSIEKWTLIVTVKECRFSLRILWMANTSY